MYWWRCWSWTSLLWYSSRCTDLKSGEPNLFSRYNVNGFVEELPQLPENRYRHACAALPSTGVRPAQPTFYFKPLQAFVVAGGSDESNNLLSSVLTLLPGAAAWTPLASLARALYGAQASVVGGRLRVTGGYDGSSVRSEVTISKWCYVTTET